MTVFARSTLLAGAIGAAMSIVGCVNVVSPERVLRIEYASEPDAKGDVESGVIYWRSKVIGREELPADLREKLGSTFPVIFQLDGKLANTCFVTNAGFGLTLLDRGKSDLRGPLWRTVDAGWSVDFTLLPDGTIRGKTGYYFSNAKSGDPSTLKGAYREVPDFDECFGKVRDAPSDAAT